MLRSRKVIKKAVAPSPTHIPDEILLYNILPRLPLKSLCRLKCVRKMWNQDISSNPFFIKQQCNRSSLSCPATVSLKNDSLAFLPTLARNPVGIPDPSLDFIGENVRVREILASTNGLLCLYCSINFKGFMYLCNPATKEGTSIPKSSNLYSLRAESIGLAFDPSTAPDYYMLVHPIRSNVSITNGVEYQFEVFSSCCGRWIKSDQVVAVDNYSWKESKPVFARGVLYWYCVDYLLWFDCDNKKSGYIMLPERMSERFVRQEIGVCRDRVMCTRVSDENLDVWMLANGRSSSSSSSCEKIHEVSIERMVECNQDVFSSFWQTMRLHSRKKISEGLTAKYQVCPLPFDGGGRIFIRVIPNKRPVKNEKVLSYDMKTGKVDQVFSGQLFQEDRMAFGYINSMVRLPFTAVNCSECNCIDGILF